MPAPPPGRPRGRPRPGRLLCKRRREKHEAPEHQKSDDAAISSQRCEAGRERIAARAGGVHCSIALCDGQQGVQEGKHRLHHGVHTKCPGLNRRRDQRGGTTGLAVARPRVKPKIRQVSEKHLAEDDASCPLEALIVGPKRVPEVLASHQPRARAASGGEEQAHSARALPRALGRRRLEQVVEAARDQLASRGRTLDVRDKGLQRAPEGLGRGGGRGLARLPQLAVGRRQKDSERLSGREQRRARGGQVRLAE